MKDIRERPEKDFKIEFFTEEDYKRFLGEGYPVIRLQEQYHQATIRIGARDTAKLLGTLEKYNVRFISELPYTLEMHFKKVLREKKEKGK